MSRAVEQELSDANEQLSEAVVTNQAITAAKRKMEQELSTIQVHVILFSFFPNYFYHRVSWTRWLTRPRCPRRSP